MARRYSFDLKHARRAIGAKTKIMEVEYPDRKLPPCAHCGKPKLKLSVEYAQEGFSVTDFMLVCTCKFCSQVTIIIYQSEVEENV